MYRTRQRCSRPCKALHILRTRFSVGAAAELQSLEIRLNAHSVLLTDFAQVIQNPNNWDEFTAAKRKEGRLFHKGDVVLTSRTHAALINRTKMHVTIMPIERVGTWRLREVRSHGCGGIMLPVAKRKKLDNMHWQMRLPPK